ncbi:MAG TPA: hypothetical protein VGR21_02380, partial [Cryptosporangiaceae bacterium]|nr:hypothetical protein [Cryptosporangiaceae bacterium]
MFRRRARQADVSVGIARARVGWLSTEGRAADVVVPAAVPGPDESRGSGSPRPAIGTDAWLGAPGHGPAEWIVAPGQSVAEERG